MIQPNPVRPIPIEELRVGNLVSKGSDKIWKLYSISNLSNQDYYGIPITKELLVEKLNAKDGGGVWYLDFGRFSIAFPSEGAYLCFEGQPGSLPITHIKYLHQLQNLVFSLTGKELEIKM